MYTRNFIKVQLLHAAAAAATAAAAAAAAAASIATAAVCCLINVDLLEDRFLKETTKI